MTKANSTSSSRPTKPFWTSCFAAMHSAIRSTMPARRSELRTTARLPMPLAPPHFGWTSIAVRESPMRTPVLALLRCFRLHELRGYPRRYLLGRVSVSMAIGRWTKCSSRRCGGSMLLRSPELVRVMGLWSTPLVLLISLRYYELPEPTTESTESSGL